MRDIDEAGRAVVNQPAVAPTAVETIVRGGRRRQRRRVSVAAALVMVVVVSGVAVGIGVSRHSATRVAVGPTDSGSVTDPLIRAHLGLDAPAGWVPVDYGDARLFVPPTWKITAGGCGGSAPGWVEVGGPYKQTCGVAAPTFIDIEGFADTHEATPARTIHGYSLYAVNRANPNDFVVPALHVTIRAEGPDRDEILGTLAPSSRLIALTYKGATPTDWNGVGYSGMTASYPPSWTQQTGDNCGGVPPAQVTLVDDESGISCGAGGLPENGPTQDGLRIGRPEPWNATPNPPQTAITNGATSMLVQADATDEALTVIVKLNATNGVPIEIGLGVDGRVAAAILASIRVDGASGTTTSVSTPTATSSNCTAQNNDARAVVAQPTSFRLDRARTYEHGQVSLDPPRASDTPKTLASSAWMQSTLGVAQSGSTFELVLARYSYLAHPATLAWVVIGHHVPIISEGPAFIIGSTAATSRPPSCGEEIDVFDASSGKGLGVTMSGSG